MRLKVRYLTRVEKRCIGYLGNGTKASTAVARPRLLVSGERVSIWVNQPQSRGVRGMARGTAGGQAQCPPVSPACFGPYLSYWPFFHSPHHISDSCLLMPPLGWWVEVLNPRTKPLLIHGHSIFQSTHIIPVSVLGPKKEYQ